MATSKQVDEFPFDWGSTVRVKSGDRALASVCGFRRVDTRHLAEEYGAEIGEYLVLVEFGGGQAKEIPASHLEAVSE